MTSSFRAVCLLLIVAAISACAPPEDPARVALRTRLKQAAPLSKEEVSQLLDEVGRSLKDKKIQTSRGAAPEDLTPAQRDMMLGMLMERAGAFDEGMRTENGQIWRVINEPAPSPNMEVESTRRLSVDVETFLPRRFAYNSAFPSPDDYSLTLVIER